MSAVDRASAKPRFKFYLGSDLIHFASTVKLMSSDPSDLSFRFCGGRGAVDCVFGDPAF